MSVNKVLFAINSKAGEDRIEALMKGVAVKVGAVQYREAILGALRNTGADILLIAESLSGRTDLLQLLKDVRAQFPKTRVIVLTNERSNRHDPIFSGLVALGIYDIINQDTVSFETIYSYIVEPRTFRDVAKYYNGVPDGWVDERKEEPIPAKGGMFSNLFGSKNKEKQAQKTSTLPTDTPAASASPDMESLRAVIQEEADRKASAKVEEIAKKLADDQNKELKAKLEDAQQRLVEVTNAKHSAEQQHYEDVKALDLAKQEALAAQKALETLQQQYEDASVTMREQLASLKSTDSPDVFQKKLDEWATKEQGYLSKIHELEEQIASFQPTEVVIHEGGCGENAPDVFDLTWDALMKYIMPDDGNYVDIQGTDTHSYLFVGTKHGVGNTTVALNTAAALADKRYKTLLIEFNSSYPLINSYFEFLSVSRGIDTAIKGLRNGNPMIVDASIIRPHSIKTDKKALQKAYKSLPEGLHFMCFSNQFLAGGEDLSITPQDMEALFSYLVNELGYLYVIIDIQPDDAMGETILYQSAAAVDRLVLTCTQDVQSVSTMSMMLQSIANSPVSHLLQNVKVVINDYCSGFGEMAAANIAKHLNLSTKRFFTIGEDRTGHYKATYGMYPYVLGRGKYTRDYRNIAAMM